MIQIYVIDVQLNECGLLTMEVNMIASSFGSGECALFYLTAKQFVAEPNLSSLIEMRDRSVEVKMADVMNVVIRGRPMNWCLIYYQ